MTQDNRTREEILESIIKEQVHLAFSKFGKMAMPTRTESDGIERKAIIKSALIFSDQEKRKAFNEGQTKKYDSTIVFLQWVKLNYSLYEGVWWNKKTGVIHDEHILLDYYIGYQEEKEKQ